jgi:hypothetical protein
MAYHLAGLTEAIPNLATENAPEPRHQVTVNPLPLITSRTHRQQPEVSDICPETRTTILHIRHSYRYFFSR